MKSAICISLLLLSALPCFGSGVSPWLPVNQSALFESDLEKLASLSSFTQLKRPYSLALVLEKLREIRSEHPELHQRLDKALARYRHTGSITHAKLSYGQSDEFQTMPNARGLQLDTETHWYLRGIWQPHANFLVSGGAQGLDGDIHPSGTTISSGFHWAQLDLGYKTHWWSPLQGSAKMLSTQAEELLSVSLSNSLPLSIFGLGFDYEAFVGQSSKQATFFQGQYSEGDRPYLSGLHLGFRPIEWWSLGFNRMFQFGGGQRPLSSKTFVRAIIDPRGADNDADVDNESGNQIASIVSKIHFDQFTINTEFAGEDTSNNKPWQLGNSALSAGIYVPVLFTESLSLNLEYSEWQNAWYVNNVYSEGYTHEGLVMGDWNMQDQHLGGTAVGGKSAYLKLLWHSAQGYAISSALRSYEYEESAIDYDVAQSAELELFYPLGKSHLVLTAYAGKDAFANDFQRLSVAWQWN